jgi:hypothetical protein
MLSPMTADTKTVHALVRAVSEPSEWSLSIMMFCYLQVLDLLTTWLGFRIGLSEASPFIQYLMQFGPMVGVACSKMVALVLAGFCIWSGRFRVIRLINYWYAALVLWNLGLILSV